MGEWVNGMGLLRFINTSGAITNETIVQIQMSGFDRIPWRLRIEHHDDELVIRREVDDSGCLHVPWNVEGHGITTLSTATLIEREEPYCLHRELARGKLAQLRGQLGDWQSAGLNVPQTILDQVLEATGYLGRAACGSSAKPAISALEVTLDASQRLVDCYVEQVMAMRSPSEQQPGLPSLLGADLGSWLLDQPTSLEYLKTFNAANLPLAWREIEPSPGQYQWDVPDQQIQWCKAQGLATSAGPLFPFSGQTLPDWLAAYEDDFDALVSHATEFAGAVVTRYRGRVGTWRCVSRINAPEVLSLPGDKAILLAARVMETIHSLDPQAELVVSFDQPWAEYLSRHETHFPPLQLADTLARADLGLTHLMLEFNVGYHPGGTAPRESLDFSRQLDTWSQMGLPLYISLTGPSSGNVDPLATRATRVGPRLWDTESQQRLVAELVPMMLAKHFVRGVFWNQLLDAHGHEFPHAGLFSAEGRPKPAIKQLAAVRREYLR